MEAVDGVTETETAPEGGGGEFELEDEMLPQPLRARATNRRVTAFRRMAYFLMGYGEGQLDGGTEKGHGGRGVLAGPAFGFVPGELEAGLPGGA